MAEPEQPPDFPEAVVASGEADNGEKSTSEKPPAPSSSPSGVSHREVQTALKTADILAHRLDK